MTFPMIEAYLGSKKVLKGHLVQNAGKNNGTLVRQQKEVYQGEMLHKIEMWKVFFSKPTKAKESRWMVQFPLRKVVIPPESLGELINCLKLHYQELYGDEPIETEEGTSVSKEEVPAIKSQDEVLKKLKKLGF